MSAQKNAYLIPGRLEDVLALIQVLGLHKHAHRSESGLRKELQRKPASAESWEQIARVHPEFFRVSGQAEHPVSLVARHVTPRDGGGRRPVSENLIQQLLEQAVTLHKRQMEMLMIDPASATAFLAGLASVSTIVKNVRDWIATDKAPEKEPTLAHADAVGTAAASDPQVIAHILKISDQIFKPIDGRIKRARKKLEEILGDPYADKERRRAVIKDCNENICEALEDIKVFNSGLLPEELQEYWTEHGCGLRT
jgi:hypothetical protein